MRLLIPPFLPLPARLPLFYRSPSFQFDLVARQENTAAPPLSLS